MLSGEVSWLYTWLGVLAFLLCLSLLFETTGIGAKFEEIDD
jgi:hypothetical protein